MSHGFTKLSASDSERENALPLFFSAILALGLHAGLLYAWRYQPKESGLIPVLADAVEVALVESAGAALEKSPEERPAPDSPSPEPQPVPPPLRDTSPMQPALPEPAPILPAPAPAPMPESVTQPREETPPPSAKAEPLIPRTKPSASAAKTPQPGKPSEGTTATGSTLRTAGESSGKVLGVPLYQVRPQVHYPAESRAAGEQGVVLLRITVNATGRPTAVGVVRSSGFARLDRAAEEGGWRCRVSNAFEGAQFEAPLRFSLQSK